jgi:methionyl-tRNA formyltransferase
MARPDVARPTRLVLFGDGAWAADSLLRLAGRRRHVVGVVVRARPSDVTLRTAARALGIPVLQPSDVNDPTFADALRALAPDLGLSIAYDQILHRPILDSLPLGCLNYHAGNLPRYRGRNVINWAIINGEREIGVTAHFMDDGVDTGDILLQRTLPIGWTDTYGDVLDRVIQAIPGLVEESVDLVVRGGYSVTRQVDLPGTYFGAREPGDEWLDWSDTSVNLHNKIRAISRPAPGARTLVNGQTVLIWRAYCDPAWPAYIATPGQVVGRRPDAGVIVKTGDATLLVQEIECEGRTGAPQWKVGTRLGASLPAPQPWLEERSAEHA